MAPDSRPPMALSQHEGKSYAAAPLLPEPGCEVVREHLQTISQLRMDMANITGLLDPAEKSDQDIADGITLARLAAAHHAAKIGA